MDPGLTGEDNRLPDSERRVDGALSAHRDDWHIITRTGAASKKRGRFETVQYRKSPTFLKRHW